MVHNPIYEGPLYETISQHFRPTRLPIPTVDSTSELQEENMFLSLKSNQNAFGEKINESIRHQNGQAIVELPDRGAQSSEDSYSLMGPVVKTAPALHGE